MYIRKCRQEKGRKARFGPDAHISFWFFEFWTEKCHYFYKRKPNQLDPMWLNFEETGQREMKEKHFLWGSPLHDAFPGTSWSSSAGDGNFFNLFVNSKSQNKSRWIGIIRMYRTIEQSTFFSWRINYSKSSACGETHFPNKTDVSKINQSINQSKLNHLISLKSETTKISFVADSPRVDFMHNPLMCHSGITRWSCDH